MQIQVLFTCDEAKIFYELRHVSNRGFIFFCLFHRVYDLICYISGFFLPRRQRKFGDNVPNCMNQYNHFYIFGIYSKHAGVLSDREKCTKCLINQASWKINSKWLVAFLDVGPAPPDSLKSACMILSEVEDEAVVCCGSPGWARLGPAHSWEVLRDPPGSQLSPGG